MSDEERWRLEQQWRLRDQQIRRENSRREMDILRGHSELTRLNGEIAHMETEAARKRRSDELTSLGKDWDSTKASLVDRFSKCSELFQECRGASLGILESTYIWDSMAGHTLETLDQQVQVLLKLWTPPESNSSTELTPLRTASPLGFTGLTQENNALRPSGKRTKRTPRSFGERFTEKKEKMMKELELKSLLRRSHLMSIHSEICDLIRIYNSYHSR